MPRLPQVDASRAALAGRQRILELLPNGLRWLARPSGPGRGRGDQPNSDDASSTVETSNRSANRSADASSGGSGADGTPDCTRSESVVARSDRRLNCRGTDRDPSRVVRRKHHLEFLERVLVLLEQWEHEPPSRRTPGCRRSLVLTGGTASGREASGNAGRVGHAYSRGTRGPPPDTRARSRSEEAQVLLTNGAPGLGLGHPSSSRS